MSIIVHHNEYYFTHMHIFFSFDKLFISKSQPIDSLEKNPTHDDTDFHHIPALNTLKSRCPCHWHQSDHLWSYLTFKLRFCRTAMMWFHLNIHLICFIKKSCNFRLQDIYLLLQKVNERVTHLYGSFIGNTLIYWEGRIGLE